MRRGSCSPGTERITTSRAPSYLDLGSATWRWQPSDVLPLPPDPKHQDAKRQRAYDRVAAGQPLADFLDDFLVQIAKSVRRP
jgi:hypothetical protein